MSTIRFELRKDLISNKTGKAPVRIIYQMSGKRTFIPTEVKLNPENWDDAGRTAVFIKKKDLQQKINATEKEVINQSAKNTESSNSDKSKYYQFLLSIDYDSMLLDSIQIGEVNHQMKDLVNTIRNIEKRFEVNGQPYSGSDILQEMKHAKSSLTKKDESRNLLFEFMDRYIDEHITIREPGSLSVYKSVKAHLLAFELAAKTKVRFDGIDYRFFSKFQAFLISRTKTDKAGKVSPMLNNTTIAKALSTLKTFLGYARRNGIKVSDEYKDFTIKKEKLEVIALEQEEFDALLNLDLSSNKRLDQTRDVFCFSCASGLRYSDIAQLRREHIHNNVITVTVKKTKSELSIPLNRISAAILHKYRQNARPLPVISNQRLNDYIKEVCQLAEIDKAQEIVRFRGVTREVKVYPKYELIHFHTGRKTFCTLSLEKGMSAEQVMAISGHQDYKSFKRYVNVNEKIKKVVMVKAWGEVNNLKVV